ncbi:hypothetical protein [Sulfitobacter sp. 1A15106]|uniref:hypothetical protein n=1 Tax=Sulfitobacter sp. 1A15106 TaxID=3368590 RepID=UPI003745FCB5
MTTATAKTADQIKAEIARLRAELNVLQPAVAKPNPARNKYLSSAAKLKRALESGALGGVVLWKGASLIDGAPIAYVATKFNGASGNEKTGAMVQTFILPDPHAAGIECNGAAPAKISPWLQKTGARSICGDCPHAWQWDESLGRYAKGSCYVREYQSPASVTGALYRDSYPVAGVDFPAEWIAELFASANVRFGSYGDPAAAPAWVTLQAASKATQRTGYTHGWKSAFDGFRENAAKLAGVVMASADSAADVKAAESLGFRCFRVAPMSEDVTAADEILCPASKEFEAMHGRRTDCAACGLCSGADGKGKGKRSVVIAAHGGTAKRVTGAACPAAVKMLRAMGV